MTDKIDNSLHTAAVIGDTSLVIALLDQGRDVNGTDEQNLTALHRAVRNGHLETAHVLIERGANINACRLVRSVHDAELGYGYDWTPLHFAAGNEQLECVILLLKAGADVDPEDDYGQTPIMLAVDDMGSPAVVRVLLEHGADGQRAWAWANHYAKDIDGPGAENIELLKRAGAGESA